ncbi:MAG: hypothetical protein R3F34_01265 [Planctomycetota bacterium]
MASTVITIFTTGALVAVSVVLASSQDRASQVERYDTEAEYLARGALQIAKRQVQEKLANWEWNEFFPAGSYKAYTATVGDQDVDYWVKSIDLVEIIPSWDATGTLTYYLPLEITARAAIDDSVSVRSMLVAAAATPVFQFAVFYTGDLEISNGPNMTIGGRVHSNGDIYMSPNGSTLTVNTNYLRANGDIYRGRKTNWDASNGTVKIRRYVENPFDISEPLVYVDMATKGELQAAGISNISGYDSNFTSGYDANGDGDFDDVGDFLPFLAGALENWGSPSGYTGEGGYTVLTGEHGIGEAITPDIESIAAYEELPGGTGGSFDFDESTGTYVPVAAGTGKYDKGFFHANAGLKIIVQPDDSLIVYDPFGNDVTSTLVGSGAVTLDEIYDARQAEGTSDKVQVAVVDVAKLNASGYFPYNGLLYCADLDAEPGLKCGGLMMKNGTELAAPLTAVSQGAVYVQGDYNTVNKKGASVVGDGVNLLSNAWNNTKTKGNLPKASDTTYNMGIITGNQDSVKSTGTYNGGLENLPRFHEDWGSKKAIITGSLVCPWKSALCDGQWVYGADRYTAPQRIWNYDTDFNNFANLPPFAPFAVVGLEVADWKGRLPGAN